MSIINAEDRKFIENKYHTQSEDFNPFNRFAYHGHECEEKTGLNDDDMKKGVEKIVVEASGMPHSFVKAKCFEFVLDNMRIDVNEHDYFVCLYNWGRPLQKPVISKWNNDAFDRIPDIKQKMDDYSSSGTSQMWLDTDHVVPNWMDILDMGFRGLLERAEKYRNKHIKQGRLSAEQKAFFDAIEIEYNAILRLINRLICYAQEHPNSKTELICESLQNLYDGAPRNTFDVLQLMYLYFMCSESVDNYQSRSLGNGFDRALHRFYKKDIESGKFSKESIKEFIAYFLMQFSAMGNYYGQPLYLCGTDYDNKTDITELTFDILDVYEKLNIYNPKIQIKIDVATKKELIYKVLKMIRNGQTSFVFCCVPGIIKSLMGCYGVTYDEARDCDISGCNEMHIRAKEACMISGLPNAAKAISYVFSNGMDNVTQKQLGLETGEVTELDSFEKFYGAFLKQFAYILDNAMDMAVIYEPLVAEINPSIMLSATVESSLEQATDAYAFGLKYPTSSLLLCSFATAVDSLLAVKELVYDEKVTTMTELKKALENNWCGYEELRKKALSAKHKYGNNDPEADVYATAIFNWFSMYVNGRKNGRGGVYKVGVPSTLHFITYGKQTDATPDGRKKGEECSKNVAPVVGMERNGVTAMMLSALNTSPFMFSEAYVLDMMLHPSAVAGEEGLEAMYGLVMSYMKNYGISIQFNIFSEKVLRDAQKNPDKYKNLQVRVSGWNTLWNNMTKQEQEAYIIRASKLG